MYDVYDGAGNVIVSGYANPAVFRIITPIGIVISVLLTALAIIGIAEKDNPKYYGIGGVQEKVKISECVEIIKNNKPMQRLMVAGAGCKLALLLFSSNGDPVRVLSFPFNGGGAINIYTILFIVFFGIGYGAYYAGIKVAVVVMFCVIPMLAWAPTLIAMKGYSLTGEKMKTIQAVNAARKEAIAGGMSLEQAMETVTDETVLVSK